MEVHLTNQRYLLKTKVFLNKFLIVLTVLAFEGPLLAYLEI